MSEGLQALSEREKETLRLLLGGHDIKSISGHLGLSVHTVNERLREARRKLGVSSSRQAARLLAEMERHGPGFYADKQFGVAAPASAATEDEQSDRPRGVGNSLAWLGGGMLIMSLIIAAAVLSSALQGTSETPARLVVAAAVRSASDAAGASSAREWLGLLDNGRWDESWNAAGTLFRAGISEAGWVSKVRSVRQPMGPVSSRVLQTVTKSASLPGAPDGEYEIVQFTANFARKHNATETVVLAHESSGWKVDGYFIK